MKVLIAGDLVPTESNKDLFYNNKISALMGKELYKLWNNSDYKIFNLEAPLCNSDIKIKKTGAHLKVNPNCINGIKEMKPSVVCLANNHILDYGVDGLNETLESLKNNNINYIGVGNNQKSLLKYFEINIDTVCYNFCDIEFSGATDDLPGTNTYSEYNTFDDVRELKEKYKNVIVIYHGGKEHYRYATPKLQKLCRKLIDCGAEIVVCQHSHCIGCFEKYNDGYIVYGQGNFIFDRQYNEFWNTGLLIEYDFHKHNINFIPYKRVNERIEALKKNEKEYKDVMNKFYARSEEIKNINIVKKKFEEYAKCNIDRYLEDIRKKSFIFRVINKICCHKLAFLLYSEKNLLNLLNDLQCDVHREIMLEGLKIKVGEDSNEK